MLGIFRPAGSREALRGGFTVCQETRRVVVHASSMPVSFEGALSLKFSLLH